MPKPEHLTKAKQFAEQSEKLLPQITAPGEKAQTLALLAIAHAVMETGYDIANVSTAIEQHE